MTKHLLSKRWRTTQAVYGSGAQTPTAWSDERSVQFITLFFGADGFLQVQAAPAGLRRLAMPLMLRRSCKSLA